MNLAGIEEADGLSRDDRARLHELIEVQQARAPRNQMLDRYYDGTMPPRDIGIKVVPDNVDPGVRCDWARKAVTTVSERVRLEGFAFDDGHEDDALDGAVRRSRLVDAFNRHTASELVHGCMFATVNRDEGGHARVRMHPADTSAAIWDDYEGRIGSGMVVADSRRTDWSPSTPVPVQVNMHLPGAVVVLRRTGPSRWVSERSGTPLDRPMMEAFSFRATGTRPFGETRITPAVRYLVDEVNRTLRYMSVSSAFYARPQKYILGLNDEQFDKLMDDKWGVYIGSTLLATTNEDTGEPPEVGQLSAASPQPYIDAIQCYGKLFSGATGVPLNSLGIVQDNPSSAEAIASQREDICSAAEDLIASSKEGLREVALMAMAVEADCAVDDLDQSRLDVHASFADPQKTTRAARGDFAVKVAGACPEYAETSSFWRDLGYSGEEVDGIMRDVRRAQAQAAIAGQVETSVPQVSGIAGVA